MVVLFLFILGLLVGSFANVLIDRLPKGESVLWGRSHCDHCKRTLRWHELIPLFSFLLQRGRCRRCRKKLSVQYPLIELTTALGFLGLYGMYPYSLVIFVPLYLLFLSLLVIFVADIKYQIIPDAMIVLGIVATILYFFVVGTVWNRFPSALLTAAASFGAFYLLWLVTRGRGMGFGDVKFVFLMGLLLGFPLVIAAFYVAFLTGAIVGVILMVGKKKTWKSRIAFGPFLVFGMSTVWVFQKQFLMIWRMFV